jgi:hypothetical protein
MMEVKGMYVLWTLFGFPSFACFYFVLFFEPVNFLFISVE